MYRVYVQWDTHSRWKFDTFVTLRARTSLNFVPKLPHLPHPCPRSVFKSVSMSIIVFVCLKWHFWNKEKMISYENFKKNISKNFAWISLSVSLAGLTVIPKYLLTFAIGFQLPDIGLFPNSHLLVQLVCFKPCHPFPILAVPPGPRVR